MKNNSVFVTRYSILLKGQVRDRTITRYIHDPKGIDITEVASLLEEHDKAFS